MLIVVLASQSSNWLVFGIVISDLKVANWVRQISTKRWTFLFVISKSGKQKRAMACLPFVFLFIGLASSVIASEFPERECCDDFLPTDLPGWPPDTVVVLPKPPVVRQPAGEDEDSRHNQDLGSSLENNAFPEFIPEFNVNPHATNGEKNIFDNTVQTTTGIILLRCRYLFFFHF